MIEVAVHWLDCELLKARASGGRGEREKDRDGGQTFPYKREHGAVWSRPHMFNTFFMLSSLCTLVFVRHHLFNTLYMCDTQPLPLFSHTPPLHLQKLLFSLGGSFLYYADHFKLYSGFCANHIKVQKVLERGMSHTCVNQECSVVP